MADAPSRRCASCGNDLPADQFWRDVKSKDGLSSWCKACKLAHKRRSVREDPRNALLSHARKRAKEYGLEFSLTRRDIAVPNFCPAMGIPLSVGDGKVHDGSPSIDRIDPTQGYTPDNVVVISYLANRLKSNATLDQIRLLCRWMEARK